MEIAASKICASAELVTSMSTRIGKERINQRKGFFYYVSHDGHVWGISMKKRAPGERRRMSRTSVDFMPGNRYFLDSSGYVCVETQDQ